MLILAGDNFFDIPRNDVVKLNMDLKYYSERIKNSVVSYKIHMYMYIYMYMLRLKIETIGIFKKNQFKCLIWYMTLY